MKLNKSTKSHAMVPLCKRKRDTCNNSAGSAIKSIAEDESISTKQHGKSFKIFPPQGFLCFKFESREFRQTEEN